ncbi:hypothetical protein PHYPSEUDO_012886 [Phytophthora pseudosyringae]|uniref:Uncharacterized protein n=1 Tax=Phytophthora pseudosyringae TaxID=221518 RepID=A0A8T1W6C5_9STRA|nr:hypothetical protein PHYPSEUDO_012886 [Phytophthora pseudosyringae]
MDELQSVGVGVALGVVIVSALAFYPGEPFDYTTDCITTTKATATKEGPPQSLPAAEVSGNQQQQQIADIEQAAQRVKIHKLQELLGMEKDKAQQLVDRAKAEAKHAITANGRSSSGCTAAGSNGAWLDRCFFIVMLGLLVWVLWQDYSINLFAVAAHMLPREAEVIRQVAAIPRGLVSQLLELWH